MGYDIGWIIPRLRSPGRLWSCASSITVAVVGLFSKLILEFLNKTTVYNKQVLMDAVRRRPPGVPLLTVSNHHSCFDDPGLWGVLEAGALVRSGVMRWSLAAHDICFTRAIHSAFFALGKCVPVVRGAGVYQPAMDFCLERLSRGEWVHIFPEGRVNVDKEHIRFKWGVGRLVAECAAAPVILPVWHEGMDRVLPNQEPYLLKFRRRVFMNVGEPIQIHHLVHRFKWGVGRLVAECAAAPVILPVWHEGMDRVLPNQEPYLLKFRRRVFMNVGEPIQIHHLVHRLRAANASEEETRKAITDRIQEELLRLRDRTHALIRRALGPQADGLLDNRTDTLVKPTEADGDAPQVIQNGREKEREL